MKLKLIFLCFMICQLYTIQAQDSIYVYKTFDDYKSNRGEKMDEYIKLTGINVSVCFKKGKEDVKLKCKDFWGFYYNGSLFRNDMITQLPCCVIKTGNCVFYSNGEAHLAMVQNKNNFSRFQVGYYYYISNDLNSEICPMQVITNEAVKPIHKDAKKKFNKFKAENPQHKNFYDCLNDKVFIYFVEKCIQQY